ncbi:nucleotide-binding universal stress protein, UspA family [Desulfuromonas soudanensis]|uniref:Universal stress protein n=1 Tax=Desulfuromonas soudanensis TaxID=1603606 RepID=A0A0M4D8W6_9BACT|nr:universal stress protein [Desulfuromonas soudanensis]ALC17847.1 nucleotide-binding universal stress protein, UspA family [Desulfuromonas soudanensis]
MKTINKILYATDFSESSLPAGDYALTLAKLAGAEVHVLHVIGEFTDRRKSRIQPESMALLEREVEIQAFKEMEGFCREVFDEEIPYTTEVVMGHPFEEIIKIAQQSAFDLIVVGTHGRTGLERVFVGSTAERLVRRSPVAVLTVRSGA